DRVWQLEIETFKAPPGFVFAPITEVVEPAEDPTALHPELQRQTANIRTDLDRFSPLEISSLVRHGYCVGRKACRTQPELFGANLPDNAPWDPVPAARGAAPSQSASTYLQGSTRPPATATVAARTLPASALRRIWSTMLNLRDWTSYVYVPIIVPIITLLPYMVVKYYERSHRISQIVESLSQGSKDLEQMTRLLEARSVPWNGVPFEEVDKAVEHDPKSFEILQDSRIMDLRSWNPNEAGKNDPNSLAFGYRRLKVIKMADSNAAKTFYLNLIPDSPKTGVRFPAQEIPPKLRRANLETTGSPEK